MEYRLVERVAFGVVADWCTWGRQQQGATGGTKKIRLINLLTNQPTNQLTDWLSD
jgi:hypothetical protein